MSQLRGGSVAIEIGFCSVIRKVTEAITRFRLIFIPSEVSSELMVIDAKASVGTSVSGLGILSSGAGCCPSWSIGS
ncbi:39725_t:CDS:2 [Gigaspora margarita]|uniref:39725_t:CDS:1 n=1 Tax=Gigaspora margarita TaxID=4874 RepID=A0ABN7UEG9_GIGMA|nr:39725_t:CDS:2 [Gigaspora margarita]